VEKLLGGPSRPKIKKEEKKTPVDPNTNEPQVPHKLPYLRKIDYSTDRNELILFVNYKEKKISLLLTKT
jgi:hypothetical protein